MTLSPAVFLDRDGVINELITEQGSQRSPRTIGEFRIIPGFVEFARELKEMGFELIVITNQPEVRRQLVQSFVIEEFHEIIRKTAGVEHFFVCWHDEEDKCDCRKPKPGLILQAARELGIDLKRSYLVGDRPKDAEAATAAGCGAILFRNNDLEQGNSFTHYRQVIDYILGK
jgi:D-glycero-D-manno-heptose 1,7-bisphosphate phosphatase